VERQTLVLNEAICLDLVSFANPVFSMMYQGIAEAISFSSAPSSLNEVLRIYKGNKLECRGWRGMFFKKHSHSNFVL
jgi:hypothetical protein